MKRLVGLTVLVGVFVGIADVSHAAVIYQAFLDGPSESPPNASPGTGFALVGIDVVSHTLSIDVTFSDLIGTTTAAHIHAPTAVPFAGTVGVATELPTFTGFPSGVTNGVYSRVFDTSLTSSFSSAFVTANGGTAAGAESALATALAEGRAYFNIHSSAFPGGEIRGFLTPVPEPSTAALMCIGGVGLVWAGRVARRKPSH